VPDGGATHSGAGAPPMRRLRRVERREQILAAATRAFARAGFAATGLDDIAAEARISRVILYRHFDSKVELYRGVLDRVRGRLADTVGTGDYGSDAIPTLLRAASEDPDGFRLLFRHAAREPDFRDVADQLTAASNEITRRHVAAVVPDRRWAAWVSQLLPVVVIEAVIAWLDAGQPDPDQAAARIGALIERVLATARDKG
jgi:AcrR family transcriptional regulator